MGTQPVRRTGWLYQLPPWRAPSLRHHHHHIGLIEAIFYLMGLFLYFLFFFELWMLEAMLWAAIWFYYAAFLAIRWAWRQSPIGQDAGSRHAVTERRLPRRCDAPTQHVDSGQLGDMRRRS